MCWTNKTHDILGFILITWNIKNYVVLLLLFHVMISEPFSFATRRRWPRKWIKYTNIIFYFWLGELHCTSCSPGRQRQSQQTTPIPNYINNDTIHAQCRHAPPTILTTLMTKNGKLKPKRSAVFPEIVQQTDTKKAEFKMSENDFFFVVSHVETRNPIVWTIIVLVAFFTIVPVLSISCISKFTGTERTRKQKQKNILTKK